MKKVFNPEGKPDINIHVVGKDCLIPSGSSDVYPDDTAGVLKDRYPWLTVTDVGEKPEVEPEEIQEPPIVQTEPIVPKKKVSSPKSSK